MPEQQSNMNIDNYAYERDLILLNNLLMKRLLQQRMRMNGDSNNNSNSNKNNNNNNNNNNTNAKPNKKTISDVYGPNVNNAVVSREMKKNFSMVEARKAANLSTTEQSILHAKPPPHRPPPILSSRHTPISRNNSNSHSEHLATVSEEPSSEKSSPIAIERPNKHHHHHHHHNNNNHHHHHHHHQNRTPPQTSSSSGDESICEAKQVTPPVQSSQPASTISSTPDSEQSFRKNSPTQTRNGSSRKSTVNKITIRQLPSCKQQTNTKCCEETPKKTTNCNQCPTNVCPPPRPFFQQPMNMNTPFRSYNFPSLNPSFYYPYNNNYNYPLMRNFNSFPQFNPLQPYNFQSSPFYLPNFFQQRPLEPLKPLKPLQFQTNPLNGQPIIVL